MRKLKTDHNLPFVELKQCIHLIRSSANISNTADLSPEQLARLSSVFIAFIKHRAPTSWTKEEAEYAMSLIKLDWAKYSLLCSLDQEDLEALVSLSYPDQVIRMYMLNAGMRLSKPQSQERIATRFLEFDESERVRNAALELLASLRWSQTENYAKILWDTGDSVKRMVALTSLNEAESPLLEHYIAQAEQSHDKNLHRVASSIRAQRRFVHDNKKSVE